MGLLDFLKGFDINAGVAAFKQTAQAVLLDVRTSGEFREGRIPGAVNLPLQQIASAAEQWSPPRRDPKDFRPPQG